MRRSMSTVYPQTPNCRQKALQVLTEKNTQQQQKHTKQRNKQNKTKASCISGPMQLKLMLFKGQLCLISGFLLPFIFLLMFCCFYKTIFYLLFVFN